MTVQSVSILWSASVERFSVSRMRDFLQWLPNLQYPCWICLHTRGSILKLVSETKLTSLKCELQLFLTSFLVDVPTQSTGLLKCTILHSTVLYYSDAVAIAQCTPSHVLDNDFRLPIILRPPQHFLVQLPDAKKYSFQLLYNVESTLTWCNIPQLLCRTVLWATGNVQG